MRSKDQIFAHQVKWSGIYFRSGRQIGFPNIPYGALLLELHLVVDSPDPTVALYPISASMGALSTTACPT